MLGSFENSGKIRGNGHFEGHVFGSGFIHPGHSAGASTIDGNLEHSGGGKAIEMGGLFDGGADRALTEYDWIDVSGNATLAGILKVDLIDGFELQTGNVFNFLRVGGTLTGQYDGLAEDGLVGNFGGVELYISYPGGMGTTRRCTPFPNGRWS
ncbi:MAG: hypothetical protein GY768_16815 [Planctomycetaceae bacterium]|nr:hypothetical protein [Planctomycetaceae bacterium]